MKICMVASEVAPYAKTGGLADVAGALSSALAEKGHDVRLFLPFYGQIDTSELDLVPVRFLEDLRLRLGRRVYRYSVYTRAAPEDGLGTYFLYCPTLYHRDSVYTQDPDEAQRFAFLVRATLECCQRMAWGPEVIHCNDWHTALLPLYLKVHYGWDRLFADTKTLLSIHNIGYQGVFGAGVLSSLDLQGSADKLYQEDLANGKVSFLKTGILYADALSTVSRTYAREIQTAEFGMGLDGLLRARSESLIGIVNGVDYGEWDPATDPRLPFHYTSEDLSGKERCRNHLLDAMGLSSEPGVPVFGVVSRMVFQKGFDLFFEVLPHLLSRHETRLTVLGSGERKYQDFFHGLQRAFPAKVSYYRGYSEDLAHLIEAGADSFLMPSRYEPCGLNQMYSLKYGTPPIVRKTGGLADTVELWDGEKGTGFVFDHFSAEGLWWAMDYALKTHRDPEAWRRLMKNGMAKDYSWERQAGEYEKLYRALLS